MSNVSIIQRPTTILQNQYWINGIQSMGANVNVSLDPVDNPIIFGFRSLPFTPTQIQRAQLIIAPAANTPPNLTTIPVGATITINGEVFTASANPVNVNQFQAFPTTPPTAAQTKIISDSLANAINKNINLNWRYFAVSQNFASNQFAVYIFARFQGSVYNISPTTTLTNNPFFNNIPSLDLSRGMQLQQFNYSFFCEVYTQQPNVPWGRIQAVGLPEEQLIADLKLRWNNTNEARFNIENYLKAQLEYFSPKTGQEAIAQVQLIPRQIISYKLRFGESFSGGYNISTDLPTDPTNTYERKFYVGESEVRWATHGVYPLGVNPAGEVKYWLRWDNTNFRRISFLTNEPQAVRRSRYFQSNVNPWYYAIAIFNNQSQSQQLSYRILFRHTFTDGVETFNFNYANTNINQNGIYLINIPDFTLGMNTLENFNQILSTRFTLQVLLGGQWQDYSEERVINWDLTREADTHNYTRLYWRNQFGQISQFDFSGYQTEALKTTDFAFQTSLSKTEGIYANGGQNNIFQKQANITTTLNSGWVNLSTYEWLKELLISTDIWVYRPITVTQQLQDATRFEMVKVNITKQNWKAEELDKWFNLTIDIADSLDINTRLK